MRTAAAISTFFSIVIALPVEYYDPLTLTSAQNRKSIIESANGNDDDINYQQLINEEPQENDLAELFKTEKPLGHVSGMAINKNDHLIVFHRGERVWDEKSFNPDETFDRSLLPISNKTIAIIDTKTGKIVDEFGENQFYMPHGLTLDHNGDYWLTDVGSHQIHKIDARTKRIVMSLGEKMVPGEDSKHFCKPTDVAVARNGHFFVADGYCNSRILKFDSNGNLIAQINAAIEEDQPSDFIVPHSLALIEDMNIICVADRENQRVQCFSAGLPEGERNVPTGIPITSANDIGRVFAIREKNHMLVGVTGDSDDIQPQLFAIDMESGKTQTFAKGINNAHALAIASNGDVFVSQLSPNRIVRISPF